MNTCSPYPLCVIKEKKPNLFIFIFSGDVTMFIFVRFLLLLHLHLYVLDFRGGGDIRFICTINIT